MTISISYPGPLSGKTGVPGDRSLTLATMALSMLSPEAVKIVNLSTSPGVESFMNFLEHNGAVIQRSSDTVELQGKAWDNEVSITQEVPDSIIHYVIGSTVFSTNSVKIVGGAKSRSWIVGPLLDALKIVGLTDENITEDCEDIIISDAVFSPPEVVQVTSAWTFEAILASVASARTAVMISYPAQQVTHVVKLATLLGFTINEPGQTNNKDIELSRRLARAAEGKSPNIRKFQWTDKRNEIIKIPGDSTIAAAVCGSAALLQKSDVTIEGVIWEQGRRGFFDVLRRMKVPVEWESNGEGYSFDAADIRVRWSKSMGIHLTSDQSHTMSSELLVLGSVASSASGKTVISNDSKSPGFSRNSFTLFARGLEKLGAHTGDFSEGIIIHGGRELRGDIIDSGGKSEVALALAVAALNASSTTTISGFEGTDYPVGEFMQIVKNLVSEITINK